MSNTRKVTVTLTRYYSKQVSVEIDVDNNIQDDDLIEHLTNDEKLEKELIDSLANKTLQSDDDVYEFQDPENEFGGHL